jgi:hypothetical protein
MREARIIAEGSSRQDSATGVSIHRSILKQLPACERLVDYYAEERERSTGSVPSS